MSIPQPSDIAKLLPFALAQGGGSVSVSALENALGPNAKLRIEGMTAEKQAEYLRESLLQAIAILVRSGSAESRDDRVFLTDRGWAQAGQLGARGRPAHPVEPRDEDTPTGGITVDLSQALPFIRLKRHNGTEITGHLRDDAQKHHGRPFVPPASQLLDELYRAEIDGVPSSHGFWTAIREVGALQNAVDLLQKKCQVRLVGYEPESRALRSDVLPHTGRGGRRGRRKGITWERLVCEVIGEVGGRADWPAIAESVGRHPFATQFASWPDETLKALRNHTAPRGRSYFEVVEIGDRTVYALTEQGKRLGARRTEDQRAPTLSKLLAKAVSPDNDSKLTAFELYALFTLAVELGKPAEAETIYHRLPEDFPDEDRYYMARHLLDRARDIQQGLQS